MLIISLFFTKPNPEYAYKRYAYKKKNMYNSMIMSQHTQNTLRLDFTVPLAKGNFKTFCRFWLCVNLG